MSSWQFCGGVDFLELINKYILSAGEASSREPGRAVGPRTDPALLESQLPHKIVNLLFTITNRNIKLTVLWGYWLSKTN